MSAGVELGSPLETILQSEPSTTELAGPGISPIVYANKFENILSDF